MRNITITYKTKQFKILLKRYLSIAVKNEKGVVAVIVAFAMVAILGMAALSLDMGTAYLSMGKMQKAIDAAAYSAGRQLPVRVDDYYAINAIKEKAAQYASINGCDTLSASDVTLGGAVFDYYTNIQIQTQGSVDTSFARIFGVDSLDFTKKAMVKMSAIEQTTGLTPLGVEKVEFQQIVQKQLTDGIQKAVLKNSAGGGIGPFYSILDYDGKGGQGVDYSRDLGPLGYTGVVKVNDILFKGFGAKVGISNEIYEAHACPHYPACTPENYVYGCPSILKIPVYTVVDKKTIRVDGFAAFLLQPRTEEEKSSDAIVGIYVKSLSTGTASGGDVTESDFNWLQTLMLVE
ncbi:pilus assembly protein TadG-related protein [Dehalobacter sp. DCM]|uniref:TadE/TadG family type IV pilus assembly protein n=1 Tax=Dehalobacter sp. DCM TaxID=2907827 RepID=UPI003081DEC1|nr:pilus assembly protein TadG-related protein [Dehalobacter sp. DCM]